MPKNSWSNTKNPASLFYWRMVHCAVEIFYAEKAARSKTKIQRPNFIGAWCIVLWKFFMPKNAWPNAKNPTPYFIGAWCIALWKFFMPKRLHSQRQKIQRPCFIGAWCIALWKFFMPKRLYSQRQKSSILVLLVCMALQRFLMLIFIETDYLALRKFSFLSSQMPLY